MHKRNASQFGSKQAFTHSCFSRITITTKDKYFGKSNLDLKTYMSNLHSTKN